ncbi:type II secretion system protein GspM [Microbulbifer thermotolerans]|uniref:Type II secretion system protein M n=1 Tax=Microbulbifer thermotolerans TaxID=252514 RepID=A0A143HM48_MICTH|nr:type II secretion system protein M [Microbulbifer thermotolerans]AMX02587.1 general secretion pathway protein GspM [Microbulbifer thermotolerans]MCX2779731.1 type II secretion system protein M [Microbulbifer thermotolerans]MCX2782337.1 type II secretion system protein M [Microbulbifer thermotolerans]MCX2794926.1 type II secretion system protein M [Microbulbifer thermotolerans]MCX2800490.1 type II secretion system protein M [Microbulbifer thermotolerans]
MKEQIEQWQQKWLALPPSDQRALGVLILFLGSMLLIYGLFLPAKHFFDGALARAEESRQLVAWIESQRPVLEQLEPGAAGQASGTLLQRVTAAAKQHKITIKRFEPEGDTRIRLWIEEARYQDIQPWLNNLIQQRFTIRTLNMDALQEEGMVSARLTLEG